MAGRRADSCPQKCPELKEAFRLIGPRVASHDNNGPIAARRVRLWRVLLRERTSTESHVRRYKVPCVPVCRCVPGEGQPATTRQWRWVPVSWSVACSVATPGVSTLAAHPSMNHRKVGKSKLAPEKLAVGAPHTPCCICLAALAIGRAWCPWGNWLVPAHRGLARFDISQGWATSVLGAEGLDCFRILGWAGLETRVVPGLNVAPGSAGEEPPAGSIRVWGWSASRLTPRHEPAEVYEVYMCRRGARPLPELARQ